MFALLSFFAGNIWAAVPAAFLCFLALRLAVMVAWIACTELWVWMYRRHGCDDAAVQKLVRHASRASLRRIFHRRVTSDDDL